MRSNLLRALAAFAFLFGCDKNLRDEASETHPQTPVFNLGSPKNQAAIPERDYSKAIFINSYPPHYDNGHTLLKVACVHGPGPLETELRILCLHGGITYVSSFDSKTGRYHVLRGTLKKDCVMEGLGNQDLKQCISGVGPNNDYWISPQDEVSGPNWEDFHGSTEERNLLNSRLYSLCAAPMNRPDHPFQLPLLPIPE